MLKVGIVGFGKMGMLHGGLLNALPDVRIEAVTDTSKLVLKGFKSVFPSVKCFTSYEKMLDECTLDLVIVTTPSFSHVPIALQVINRNIHVFVEKPLSNNLQSALELAKSGNSSKLITMVGFCMRYNPMFAKGKQIIEAGELGGITEASAYMYCSDIMSEQKGWRFNPQISGGGVLIDFGIHMVDMLYSYFGKINAVSGTINSIYSAQVEDEVSAEFDFQNGVKAQLHSSWSNPEYRKPYYKLVVTGSKGTMTITDQELSIDRPGTEPEKLYYPDLYEGVHIDIGGPHFSKQMKDLVDAISRNENSQADLTVGVYIQHVVESIYAAAASGGKKMISEDF
ncbi:Gfo/Idh/MocA family oxidoreductase [Cohnella sp. LGH]|uniref:Gfo/Idh/MocA family protein n=1 Tax=Cohnella sp. LGH TaxID=1619153 RepID=UPI001ADD3595|nr:Gfo/Idh/MocA family oxidoreductase [Cohnella sp. LGH]QTH42328.1 Gfo/Idh/MocA family oxidoreductase [Cohnella sp. LGH]